MRRFPLGRSGLEVSRIGLGCVTFGREIGEEESFRLLDYAVEHGINLLDTSEAYGSPSAHSERIIGNWIRSLGARRSVLVQTKVRRQYDPREIRAALDGSLERLQMGSVDIYLFHIWDPVTPLAESIPVMDEIVETGRARAWGCSNWNAEQLSAALQVAAKAGLRRPETVEPMYNLVHREIEADLLPLCREQRIGVTSYSPLGAGFLTGKYNGNPSEVPAGTRFDVKPGHQRIYFSDTGFEMVRRLRDLSESSGISMAKLAAGWVMYNQDVTTVLVGARSTQHIDNALAAEEQCATLAAMVNAQLQAEAQPRRAAEDYGESSPPPST